MNARRPFYASVAVLGCLCVACFIAGSIELADRGQMLGIDSKEAAEQARFAVELYAIGALLLVATSVFLLRRRGWTWWLVLGALAGIFVFALIEGLAIDPDDQPGWFYFAGLPLLTGFLLFVLRQVRARPTRPLDAISHPA